MGTHSRMRTQETWNRNLAGALCCKGKRNMEKITSIFYFECCPWCWVHIILLCMEQLDKLNQTINQSHMVTSGSEIPCKMLLDTRASMHVR